MKNQNNLPQRFLKGTGALVVSFSFWSPAQSVRAGCEAQLANARAGCHLAGFLAGGGRGRQRDRLHQQSGLGHGHGNRAWRRL